MKFFFMTAGSTSEKDYRWWEFNNKKLEKMLPQELPHLKVLKYPQFSDWLDGDPTQFSLLLARTESEEYDHFFLVLCNLETNRHDHQRRMIRNSVILFSENRDDIWTIRRLAAAALDDILRQETAKILNCALTEVTDSSQGWFKFNHSTWIEFLGSDKLRNQEFDNTAEEKNYPIISKDSRQNRESVRFLLLNQSNLPEKDVIAVVTGFKEPKFFQEQKSKICFALTEIEPHEQSTNLIDTISEKFNSAAKTIREQASEKLRFKLNAGGNNSKKVESALLIVLLALPLAITAAYIIDKRHIKLEELWGSDSTVQVAPHEASHQFDETTDSSAEPPLEDNLADSEIYSASQPIQEPTHTPSESFIAPSQDAYNPRPPASEPENRFPNDF